MGDNREKLHIAIFPWLAYGHILPFLQLAKFLAQKGHHVSFLSTPKTISRLPEHRADIASSITFVELSLPPVEGLPEGVESTAELPAHRVPYLKKAYDLLEEPLTHLLQNSRVDWMIYDFASYWLPPVLRQLGVNSVFFFVFSAYTLVFMGPPSEFQNGRRRKPEDFMVAPEWVDFPCDIAFKPYEMVRNPRSVDDDVPDFDRFRSAIQGCRFLTLRSCPEFEPDSTRLLAKLFDKPIVVSLGMLPPSMQENTADEEEDKKWKVLKEWLDDKREKSVVYVAFGTEVTLSQEMSHELAHGIEKSGLPFVWVAKNRLVVEGEESQDTVPPGFEERVSGRGLVWNGWAPQLRILAHPSVGGFVTHCGWNSVIEALGFGRVLILLSGASSDQGLNARMLHAKRVGLEIERDERDGSFSSDSVAQSIRRVMVEEEGQELRANAWSMKEICGNVDVNRQYLNELTRLLEEDTVSTRSL